MIAAFSGVSLRRSVAGAVVVVMVACVGLTGAQVQEADATGTAVVSETAPASVAPCDKIRAEDTGEWKQRFYDTYRLDAGEAIKRIAPPFIPERADYYRIEYCGRTLDMQRPPDYFTFGWDGTLERGHCGYLSRSMPSIATISQHVLNLAQHQLVGDPKLWRLTLPGDWILRVGMSDAEKMSAFQRLIRQELGYPIAFEQTKSEREVVVATGTFRFTPLTGTHNDDWVHIYAETLDPVEPSGGITVPRPGMLRILGHQIGLEVIDKTHGPARQSITVGHHKDSSLHWRDRSTDSARLDMILANVSRQTGLQFERTREPMTAWTLIKTDPNWRPPSRRSATGAALGSQLRVDKGVDTGK